MKKAVYAGSFDPITVGHLWMIEAGAELFDELVVAIGINPDKKYTFSLQERLRMLEESLASQHSIKITSFENKFLVDYADSVGAQYILRGIRNEVDYEYERGMRHINSDLHQGVTTVFLMPQRAITEISSSLVKGLIGPSGWQAIVEQYVPEPVFRALCSRYQDGND